MSEPRRFAIGDIHGCYRTFRTMVEEILRVNKNDRLYLLGDYIDRGPSSRQVLDYILRLQETGYMVKPVLGNHEYMLLRSLEEEEDFRLWILNGCAATLRSFGVDPLRVHDRESVFEIPGTYIRFLSDLPVYENDGDYLFVHAGIPRGTGNMEENTDIVLWTRDESVDEHILGRRTLIHGHTPVSEEMIRLRLREPEARVINLDAGCVYDRFPSLGNLAALDLDSREVFFLKNMDRE